MRITQEPSTFQPITITLQTKHEADLFLSIIDKINAATNNAGLAPKVTKAEMCLATEISDWFTDSSIGLR